MDLKNGVIRLSEAAVWLSQKTGRHFTIDDLLDAADQLPISALIPRSLANPRFSGPVQRAFRAKLIEVERATDVAALGGTLTDDEIAEKAVKLLPETVRLRFEWEKEAIAEGAYSMTAKDVRLLDLHGVQRLSRAVPASDNIFEEGFPSWIRSRGFHPWIHQAIKFRNPVDITADMLCVLRTHLLQYAEQAAAQQVENPAQMPDPARGQEAEPETGDVQTHQGQAAPAKRQRHDYLALELERILADLRKQDKSTATHAVMAALKERAGRPESCIAASVPEGVIWTRETGKDETLNVRALARRLKNMERRESR